MDKPVSIAVIGGETLLGREVRELLEAAAFPTDITLFSAEGDDTGVLTVDRGEAAIMTPLASANLSSSRIVFLTGSPESAAKVIELVGGVKKPPVIIDVVGALEDHPEARLRAPMVEDSEAKTASPIQLIAHPAAISLALFLKRLQGFAPVRHSVVLILEPVSERGQRGLDELQQQTVGLLSFKKLNKEVFDAQVSFNLLPRYGSDAPRSLEEIEQNIHRHLASILPRTPNVLMPSLRVIQAPVFHGYSISAWIEFENNPGPDALAAGLASTDIEVRTGDEEVPSNVGAAGQSGITVGAISNDSNNARACWFWIVADNLRMAAENAVEVARESVQ